ncbi:MAG: hypothetical protein HOO97_01665 [Sideroxydans sp.]|nr:hypothetical protein [Sideroxydans sp.]
MMAEFVVEKKTFDNRSLYGADRFSELDRKIFFDKSKEIMEAWAEYIHDYSNQTEKIFGSAEFPWSKFDEQTWVSSLAVAIAKKFPNALVVAEMPVIKSVNSTKLERSNGNADMWCCLDSAKLDDSFNFYLEAKVSSKNKRNIDTLDKTSWDKSGELITETKDVSGDSHFSRVIRDYLKSTGTEIITSRSPHANEEGRVHKHAYLALILLPVRWAEEWPAGDVDFKSVFPKPRVDVLASKGRDGEENRRNISRSIYNIPATCMLMRKSEINNENKTGFIALMMMLGGSGDTGKRLWSEKGDA